MNGEIPVVATIAFGMGIDKANTKKGLSDDAKDIQTKGLQTGFEKMLEYCEKQRQESTHEVSDKMEKLMNHSDMIQGKRKKKRNNLDSRMEKEEAARLKLLFRTNSNVVSKRVE
ncbi:hypothetical protein WR25_08998 [Diploscapter pachys]|uniref:Uncharacterized protein n=1 Tax=Diploscapter pachys TaxID=2018661 RepID=A0A2A2M1C8_9BILA|nr:hypothetical protein WR25_08998 [Diploscapter pachys]